MCFGLLHIHHDALKTIVAFSSYAEVNEHILFCNELPPLCHLLPEHTHGDKWVVESCRYHLSYAASSHTLSQLLRQEISCAQQHLFLSVQQYPTPPLEEHTRGLYRQAFSYCAMPRDSSIDYPVPSGCKCNIRNATSTSNNNFHTILC